MLEEEETEPPEPAVKPPKGMVVALQRRDLVLDEGAIQVMRSDLGSSCWTSISKNLVESWKAQCHCPMFYGFSIAACVLHAAGVLPCPPTKCSQNIALEASSPKLAHQDTPSIALHWSSKPGYTKH